MMSLDTERAHQNAGLRDPKRAKESFEQVPIYTAVLTYLGFYILMFLGYLSQLFFSPKGACEANREGYAPLYDKFENFYLRYVIRRLRDSHSRPVSSGNRGGEVVLKDRVTHDYGWTFEFTGKENKCINLGSYDYLGFAESSFGEDCIRIIREKNGLGLCSPRIEYGTTELEQQLEALTAEFLGTEDAVVFGSGFATSAWNMPSIVSKGCLVLSDEKNHASLVLGIRLSGAVVKIFKHNNMTHLEKLLREAIVKGQPLTGTPWRKILIVVEGIYSMEGSIVHLPEVLALKKKYKAYLYIDEAHSIGALGPRGRGVVEYYGLNARDVDILMGTFSKSFGSTGGYIAGSKELVNHIRANSYAATYASVLSPPIVQHIIYSMSSLMDRDGTSEGRIRFCLMATHTKEQLDYVLNLINDLADKVGLRYSRKPRDPNPIPYDDEIENVQ